MFLNTEEGAPFYDSYSHTTIRAPKMLQSRLTLCATLWTTACQAPLSMGFSRQEYRSGLPFPSPEDPPDPGTEPGSPTLQADPLLSEPAGKFSEMQTLQQMT